jgi:Fur family zinc uptake transcriptional regulator
MKRQLSDNDRVVLGTLGRSDRPLSAYDILDRTEALKAPVQVYRALQKLESRGLVHRIEALNAFVACADEAHAHEHDHSQCGHRPGFVICRACGAVREFEDRRIAQVATAAAGADFSVELVSLEVYGRCAACRGAA